MCTRSYTHVQSPVYSLAMSSSGLMCAAACGSGTVLLMTLSFTNDGGNNGSGVEQSRRVSVSSSADTTSRARASSNIVSCASIQVELEHSVILTHHQVLLRVIRVWFFSFSC